MLIMAVCLIGAEINENAGEYGFKFLQIPVNPVSIALGSRGSGSQQNPAVFINQPALAAVHAHRNLSVSHSIWLEETGYSNVMYSYSDRRKHFGAFLRNLDYGEVENRDDSGTLIGEYSPVDMNMMINFAMRMTPSTYLGMNAGVVYQKLNTASAYGLSTDLGFTYLPPLMDSQLSFSLRNLGVSSKMNIERIDFPVSAEVELSKSFAFDTNSIMVGACMIKAIDEDIKSSLYGELELSDMLYLRSGYKLNYDAEDFSAGLGIRYRNVAIDYGWASFTEQLNDVHSFGITYNF